MGTIPGEKWVHDGYGLTIKAVSVGLYPENPLWQTWKEDRWRDLRQQCLLPTWFAGVSHSGGFI